MFLLQLISFDFWGALLQKEINYRKYDERALSSKELMLLPLATLAGSKCGNPLNPKTCNSLEFLNFQLKFLDFHDFQFEYYDFRAFRDSHIEF